MKQISSLLIAFVIFFFKAESQFVVFADDYAAGITFAPFGGSVNNLSVDGTQFHSGSKSLKIPVTTGYTGGALVSPADVDLSAYNVLSFWAKNDAAFLLDGVGFGNAADGNLVFEAEWNGVNVTSTWKKFYVPIPAPSKATAIKGLFHFAEGSGEGAYNIWIDDIQFENIAPGIVGTPTASMATETISKEVSQTFTANGLTSIFPVNSVNQQMKTGRGFYTWTSSNTTVATVDQFGTGTALSGGSTNVTAKLGTVDAGGVLTVNVTAPLPSPTVAAPSPTRAGYSVKSLFSNVYTNSPVETWATDWSSCCRDYAEIQINGNDTKKYTLRHFTGVEFIGSPIDATSLDSVHIDLWTPNASPTFKFRLVNFGSPNTESTVERVIAPNSWQGIDIALSEFTGLANRTRLSQILFLVPDGTSATFYIDNVYFYKTGASLPVTLSGFNVNKRGNASVINWNTATEINSKGYSVERSINGTDWKELQFVNSGLNTTSAKQYSILDNNPSKGINYYRLKQIDLDGKYTYSSIQSLKFSGFGSNSFSFYPNPAKNRLNVLLETINSNTASLQLVNSQGNMVRNIILGSRNSDSNIAIDISTLTKGVYYLTLKDGPVVSTSKVMIN